MSFISEPLYQEIKKLLPIACVDLIIQDNEGQVLLVLRRNEPAARQWWFAGGRIHFGETRLQAAHRKLKEETGLARADSKFEIEELGTYDLLLPLNSGEISHGITTLYKVQISKAIPAILDAQSLDAKWKLPQKWLNNSSIHPFIAEGLSRLKRT